MVCEPGHQHHSVINSIDDVLLYSLLVILGLEVGVNVAFALVVVRVTSATAAEHVIYKIIQCHTV